MEGELLLLPPLLLLDDDLLRPEPELRLLVVCELLGRDGVCLVRRAAFGVPGPLCALGTSLASPYDVGIRTSPGMPMQRWNVGEPRTAPSVFKERAKPSPNCF